MAKETKQPIVVTISQDEYSEHCDSSDGLCLACGEWKYGDCEPDARDYECDDCGVLKVYGTEEALMMGRIVIGDEE
jgi:hypothetical protein